MDEMQAQLAAKLAQHRRLSNAGQFIDRPLHGAALVGSVSLTRHYLAKGLDVHGADPHDTPLFWAVYGGSVPVVQLLLDHGASVERHDATAPRLLMGMAVEYIASSRQLAKMLEVLHRHGAWDHVDDLRAGPAAWLASARNDATIRAMLEGLSFPLCWDNQVAPGRLTAREELARRWPETALYLRSLEAAVALADDLIIPANTVPRPRL